MSVEVRGEDFEGITKEVQNNASWDKTAPDLEKMFMSFFNDLTKTVGAFN
jgi:hypothetical protein